MRKLVLCLLIAAVAMPLVACGNDDDDNKTQAAGSGQAAAGAGAEYCKDVFEIDADQGPDIDFESLSPDQQKTEIKKYVKDTVGPLAEKIRGEAPAEIKTDINTLADTINKVGATGDFEAFDKDPAVKAADARTHAYDLRTCGWKRQDVSGTEFTFTGAPSTRATGKTSWEFSNKGSEDHGLAIMRINDDVKDSVADLVKLDHQAAEKKMKYINSTEASPGESDYTLTDLTPGRYVMACFLHVGGKEDQPTHASKGMVAEFKVS